jgi:hypothetical protein
MPARWNEDMVSGATWRISDIEEHTSGPKPDIRFTKISPEDAKSVSETKPDIRITKISPED